MDGTISQEQQQPDNQVEKKTTASSSLSDKSAELLSAIPEEMRDAIAKLIQQTVEKQVDERVSAEVEKMQAEVNDLKEQLGEIEKKKSEKPAGTPSRIGGVTRPQTAVTRNVASKIDNKRIGGGSKSGAATGGDTSPSTADGLKSQRNLKPNGATTGLKRPTTSTGIASRFGQSKPSVSGKGQDAKSPNPTSRANGPSTKATPVRSRIGAGGPVVKSAEKDEVDEIYKEKDPIGVSLETRKKAGQTTAVVQNKNAKSGKFFFTLSTKGEKLVISDKAKYNNAKELGQLDKDGNLKVVADNKPCLIESQLNMRLKEQGESYMNVVQKKDAKEGEEGVFKLKLTGGQPQLKKAEEKQEA